MCLRSVPLEPVWLHGECDGNWGIASTRVNVNTLLLLHRCAIFHNVSTIRQKPLNCVSVNGILVVVGYHVLLRTSYESFEILQDTLLKWRSSNEITVTRQTNPNFFSGHFTMLFLVHLRKNSAPKKLSLLTKLSPKNPKKSVPEAKKGSFLSILTTKKFQTELGT